MTGVKVPDRIIPSYEVGFFREVDGRARQNAGYGFRDIQTLGIVST